MVVIQRSAIDSDLVNALRRYASARVGLLAVAVVTLALAGCASLPSVGATSNALASGAHRRRSVHLEHDGLGLHVDAHRVRAAVSIELGVQRGCDHDVPDIHIGVDTGLWLGIVNKRRSPVAAVLCGDPKSLSVLSSTVSRRAFYIDPNRGLS